MREQVLQDVETLCACSRRLLKEISARIPSAREGRMTAWSIGSIPRPTQPICLEYRAIIIPLAGPHYRSSSIRGGPKSQMAEIPFS